MEKGKEPKYEVELTASSRIFYFELLEFLYANFSKGRAEEISTEILEKAFSLDVFFDRGSPEPELADRTPRYRYLLYQRSNGRHIKIIYYVDHQVRRVYITDFFPTEMDSKKISNRNKNY